MWYVLAISVGLCRWWLCFVVDRLTCSLSALRVGNVSVSLTVANQSTYIPVEDGLRIECAASYYGQEGEHWVELIATVTTTSLRECRRRDERG